MGSVVANYQDDDVDYLAAVVVVVVVVVVIDVVVIGVQYLSLPVPPPTVRFVLIVAGRLDQALVLFAARGKAVAERVIDDGYCPLPSPRS